MITWYNTHNICLTNVHPCQVGPLNSPLATPLDEIDEECDINWGENKINLYLIIKI